MNYKLVISLILTGLIIVFVMQNAMVVEVRFFFWTFALSQALLIFFVLVIGIVTGWLSKGHLLIHKKDKEKMK